MKDRICCGCHRYLPPDKFDKAHPEFPTIDGLNFNCRECVAAAPPYRLKRVNGKVEQDT